MCRSVRASLFVALLSLCVGLHSGLRAADAPYTIVTTDGQRIGVLDPPRNTSKVTKFRTHPDGRLSSFPSARIDWKATDDANAAPATTPTASPLPSRPTGKDPGLSDLAEKLSVDEGRANAVGDTMKLKTGKAVDMSDDRPFFGEKSVMRYLSIRDLVFSAAGCPVERAVFAGAVVNNSKKKLRDLKGLVLLAERGTRRTTERMQSFDPPNLAPGDEGLLALYVSCDYARSSEEFVAFLRDVSGTAEDLETPGRENPFVQPTKKERK